MTQVLAQGRLTAVWRPKWNRVDAVSRSCAPRLIHVGVATATLQAAPADRFITAQVVEWTGAVRGTSFSVFVALQDVNQENGVTMFVPCWVAIKGGGFRRPVRGPRRLS